MKALKTGIIIYFVICCFLLCYARTTTAFQSIQKPPRTIAWQLLATKKGFGKSTPEKSFQTVAVPPATTVTPSVINQVESSSVSSSSSGQEKSITTPRPKESSSATTTTNAGQRALQELRRQRAEERDQELRMLRDMMTADEQIQSSGSASIPENVAQRMGLRMLPFVGIPFFGGMGAFITFWYLATYKNMEFEPTLVAASTIVLLVIGLLGMSYSVMSASWDPDREGSSFGWDEFQLNVQNIKDGLRRSNSNAILRDKMSNLSKGELQAAIQDLDQREKKNNRDASSSSLQSKLQDELE